MRGRERARRPVTVCPSTLPSSRVEASRHEARRRSALGTRDADRSSHERRRTSESHRARVRPLARGCRSAPLLIEEHGLIGSCPFASGEVPGSHAVPAQYRASGSSANGPRRSEEFAPASDVPSSTTYRPRPMQHGSLPQIGVGNGEVWPAGNQQQHPLQSIHIGKDFSGMHTAAQAEPSSLVPPPSLFALLEPPSPALPDEPLAPELPPADEPAPPPAPAAPAAPPAPPSGSGVALLLLHASPTVDEAPVRTRTWKSRSIFMTRYSLSFIRCGGPRQRWKIERDRPAATGRLPLHFECLAERITIRADRDEPRSQPAKPARPFSARMARGATGRHTSRKRVRRSRVVGPLDKG